MLGNGNRCKNKLFWISVLIFNCVVYTSHLLDCFNMKKDIER